MFSWFKWPTSQTDTGEQNTKTAETNSLSAENPQPASFDLYRVFIDETKRKDNEKIVALQAKVNQAIKDELATFQQFYDAWQLEVQQKSNTQSQILALSDGDSQQIEMFQSLMDQFRKSIISFFAGVDNLLQRIVSTNNKNTLSYTLVNQFQLKNNVEALKNTWHQIYWQLSQAQLDEQQTLFLVVTNLSVSMLDTVIMQLKKFTETANQFFDNLLADNWHFSFNQIEDEMQKWVIWPLAITLKDMKAQHQDLKTLLEQNLCHPRESGDPSVYNAAHSIGHN